MPITVTYRRRDARPVVIELRATDPFAVMDRARARMFPDIEEEPRYNADDIRRARDRKKR